MAALAAAFERSDVDAVVALLTDDAWLRMPPVPLEYQGRELAAHFFSTVSFPPGRRYRMVATRANHEPAFGSVGADNVVMDATASQPGEVFMYALVSAYRRACLARTPLVETDVLLYDLALRTRLADGLLPNRMDPRWRPLRRVRTGLHDAEPPQRTLLRPLLDEEVALVSDLALREAAYKGSTSLRSRGRRRRATPPPAFSPCVRHAVYEAIHEASRRGLATASPHYLMLAVLSTPGSAVNGLLAQWLPQDHESLTARIRAAVRADVAYLIGSPC